MDGCDFNSTEVWKVVFGRLFFCCHLIVSTESGMIGSLVCFVGCTAQRQSQTPY